MATPGSANPIKESIHVQIYPEMAERLHFKWLPLYADFLLRNRIPDLAAEQMRLGSELKIPLLSYFARFTPDQLLEFGRQGLIRLMQALSANRAGEYIEQSVMTWVNNKIPEISRNQISPEDISLLSFIRCKLFRDSLPFYTRDQDLSIRLMEEVNVFTTAQDTVSIRTLLSMQQELYEQAQQIAHIGNWSMDLASHSIVWSNELFRIYELEPEKVITQDLALFNHPEDAEYVQEQMRISRNTGQPHDFYYRVVLRNGRVKFLHAMGQVTMNEAGEAIRLFGTLQDVTVQKNIERQHRENEYFIQKITELTPSLIGVYNIHSGKYLFINQAIQTLLGYSVAPVLQNGTEFFRDIMHPDDLPRVLSENNNALAEQNRKENLSRPDKIVELRYRLRHANGQYRWFHTFGTIFERNAANQIETVIYLAIDVSEQMASDTELKLNAEQIRQQEDRYYKMINEVEDYAILLLSPDGIIENWNSGAEKIKGYKSTEIVGKHFRIFYPPEDRENKVPESLIRQALQEGKASHEGWRLRKDQTKFWGYVVITALHDKDGGIIGFSKVTRDLTQKKIAEDNLNMYMESLEHKNRELEEKNKELESFSYIASHDLQEPVRKIRIWTNRIEETEVISESTRDSLARIQKACVRMQRLIQGVLQYSQTDMVLVPRELTDLDQILDEVLSDFTEIIEEKQIRIHRDPLPSLKLIRIQFVQLFSNIISNAVKYSREDVPLEIEIRCNLEKKIPDLSGNKKSYYSINISDNGIGFMPEYSDKMFELFRRLESGAGYTGSGIGLAICSKIVKNHGGSIRATGNPGKGASFEIRLPAE
jgi:PAS domain S-box-containing protein